MILFATAGIATTALAAPANRPGNPSTTGQPAANAGAQITTLTKSADQDPSPATVKAHPRFSNFQDWNAAFSGPIASRFGIGPRNQVKNSATWYNVHSQKPEDLSFDVSNNQLGASILRDGSVRAASVLKSVGPAGYGEKSLRGDLARREMVGAGPWSVRIRGDGLPDATPAQVDLLDGMFPLLRWEQGQLRAELLYFAPVDPDLLSRQPRALIAVIRLTNTAAEPVAGTLAIDGAPPLSIPSQPGARCAFLPLEGAGSPGPEFPFEIPAGSNLVRSFAFLAGSNAGEIAEAAKLVGGSDPLGWLNKTRAWRLERLGKLTIPDSPIMPELLVRYIELCRQSVFYQPDGTFAAGGLGPDCLMPPVQNVWLRDSFYQMLAMSQWQPALAADAIRFFLRYGMPPKAYGRGKNRFPQARPVTHSLSNALTPFVLAGAYYQATGDKAFFESFPELLAAAKVRFGEMLDSRPDPDVFLFPSMYISDGDARGDYHTGTNAFALAAIRAMSRLAREVYRDEALAAEWSQLADRVQADLLKRCAGPSPDGWRFFEGANADGTFVKGHDGEESDIALMPFYGLLEPDDPAIVNHSRLSLDVQNPMYEPLVDGVLWVDGNQEFPATFPAWVSALAGARDETELQTALDRVVHRTDLNGAPWWWPYPAVRPKGGQKEVTRRHGDGPVTQSGWSAAVFACKFVHDILGIRADVPARRFSLRPFLPWSSFSWEGARFGDARFDVSFSHASGRLTATITNLNAVPYECDVEWFLPEGMDVGELRIDGEAAQDAERGKRYERQTLKVARTVQAGGCLQVNATLHPSTKQAAGAQ